jgi:drug/metabolite transporter (DMT)-like permease
VAPLEAAADQVTATSILNLPIMPVFEAPWSATPWQRPESSYWLGCAVDRSRIGAVFFATAGATNLLLVTFFLPVTVILLRATFLGEHLKIRQVAGIVLIVLGLAAIDGRAAAVIRPAK